MKYLVLAIALSLILGFVTINLSTQPVSKNKTDLETFVVKRGESVQSVANRLAEVGLVRHPWPLLIEAKLKSNQWQAQGKSVQAGSFKLSPAMSPTEILETLTQGTEDLWLTIPEGWRIEEVAELAASQLDNFDASVFIELAAESEGMLFPDTYLVPRQFSEAQLYDLLTNTFQKKIVDASADEIAQSDLDFDQLLTLASLVEREARGEQQMRTVAGILYNRLEIGMALQVDATLQYAKAANADGDWWTPPTAADKKIASPYNTYLYPGLPPGPICSPGAMAFAAVLNPLTTDDLYYIHATDGSLHTAADLETHQRNVNQYLR